MDESAEISWLKKIFSQKTRASSGIFKLKFPGLALAWLVITASTLVRLIVLPPLLHNAADISELKCEWHQIPSQQMIFNHFFSFSFLFFVICSWTIWSDQSKTTFKCGC